MHAFLQEVFVPGLTSGALYALIAVGFTVLYRVTGVLNFAHGNLVMMAPMGVLVAHVKIGLPVVLAYVLAIAATVAFALIEERLAIRPFLRSHNAVPWIVSTLGASVILGELLSIPFHGADQAFPYGISARAVHVFGLATTRADLALIVAVIVIAVGLSLWYARTRLGLMLSATAEDLDGATAIGIRTARMSQIAAATAAIVAALTGLLFVPAHLVSSNLGLEYLFYGFVAASLGGLGSLKGSVLGGFVVGVAAQASATYLGALYVNLAIFGGLLALYLIRPYGLFGRPALRAV